MKPRVLASVATAITVAVALSFLLLALSPCGHQPAAPVSNTPVAQQPRIDVHTHLSVGSLPVLLELMDRYGLNTRWTCPVERLTRVSKRICSKLEHRAGASACS